MKLNEKGEASEPDVPRTGAPLPRDERFCKGAHGFASGRAAAKAPAVNAPSPFAASAMVFAGGGAGAVLRYQVGRGMTHWFGPGAMTAFPWATLTVNVAGSLAMGLLAGWLARHGPASFGGGEHWRLLVGVGLLGGFTTFSSFSLELMLLIERGQSGAAFAYAAVSVLAGLTGLYIGLIVMRLAA